MPIGISFGVWQRSVAMLSRPGYLIGYNRFRTLSAFDKEKNAVSGRCGLPITFVYASRSDGLEVGDAIVFGLPNRPLLMRIGLNGLSDSNLPVSKVSDLNFARLFNGLWHEEVHIHQTFDIAQKSQDEYGLMMACSLIAPLHNKMLFGRNQLLFLCESNARNVAFRRTFDEFSNMFGEKIATDVVLSGFNAGYLGRNAILGRNSYTNLTDVYQAFSNSYGYTSQCRKCYDKHTKASDDEIAITFHLFDDNPHWRYFRDMFYNAKSGSDQEVMMAGVHLYLHPEFAQYYEAFDGLDFSPEVLFGRSFPESRESILRRLPECYLSSEDKAFLSDISSECQVGPCCRDMTDLDKAFDDIVGDSSDLGDWYELF